MPSFFISSILYILEMFSQRKEKKKSDLPEAQRKFKSELNLFYLDKVLYTACGRQLTVPQRLTSVQEVKYYVFGSDSFSILL